MIIPEYNWGKVIGDKFNDKFRIWFYNDGFFKLLLVFFIFLMGVCIYTTLIGAREKRIEKERIEIDKREIEKVERDQLLIDIRNIVKEELRGVRNE